MRTLLLLSAALLALAAAPARAQLSTRMIALESGASTPLGSGPGAHAPAAVAAALWLDGDLDLVLRLALGTAPRTSGRPAAGWMAGTAALRWSLAPGPLRPQLLVEAGWTRGRGPGGANRLALGGGGALEWFYARDLSVALAAAVRRAPAGPGARLDLTAALAAYF
ncbi:hypothetical protein [Anaeromyxobacter oryzae]|uniref:Uncharacterized protein n=1 Tax=Anaeromyxobacter oryzae TaxID=2918170 RepID=A0ABN6N0T9_9BACT|nr:hypothetical protein [Anaeromyxobacter oryzae]BDG06788.1 hypothetical protein AMOR_57840 [Anaeromyxobacter oryzae]